MKAGKPLQHVFLLAAFLFSVSFSASAGAASRENVTRRLEEFRQFFVNFQYAPDKAIPSDLLAECHGVIIMRQYKAGFVFGVKGGDGVIFLHDRDTGEWSAPAFVVSGEGSFGLQIGGQAIDAIVLIMNRSGVDMLLRTRFKIGVDASAAAGPVGRDASAQVGPGTALLAYSRSKGLYAGASFEGGTLLNNDKFNRALYGMNIGIRDILINQMVPIPPEAGPMIETLKSYSARSAASYAGGGVHAPYGQPMQHPAYGTEPTPTDAVYPQGASFEYDSDGPVYSEPHPYYYESSYPDQGGYDTETAVSEPQASLQPPASVPPPQYDYQELENLDRAAADAAEAARAAAEAAAEASRAASEAAARAARARGR